MLKPPESTPRLRQRRARITRASLLTGVRITGAWLVAGAFLTVASACATAVDTAIVAQPGQSFELPLGRTATLNGTAVKITFTSVKTDSRCPTDVQCVWAGEAKIELTVSTGGTAEAKTLSLTPPDNETTVGDTRIRFVGLAPVPRQADRDKPREYVAQLVVSRG